MDKQAKRYPTGMRAIMRSLAVVFLVAVVGVIALLLQPWRSSSAAVEAPTSIGDVGGRPTLEGAVRGSLPVSAAAERDPVDSELVLTVKTGDRCIAGASVWIIEGDAPLPREVALSQLSASGTTNESGQLLLPRPGQSATVWAGTMSCGFGCATAEPQHSVLCIQVPTGTVRFSAMTASGGPAAGIEIELSRSQVPYNGAQSTRRLPSQVLVPGPRDGIYRGTTGSDGVALVRGLPPGRYLPSLGGNVVARTELPSYLDISASEAEVQATVLYPLVSMIEVSGDDVVAIKRPQVEGAVAAGAGAGEIARISRWLRKRWNCRVHVVAAQAPATIRSPATAVCRRSGDIDLVEVYQPVDDQSSPQVIDATNRRPIRDWPLVTFKLVSDGFELPGGAWVASGGGGDSQPSVTGIFGRAAAMPPGRYQIFTMLSQAQRATDKSRFDVAESTSEVAIDLGAGLRM